MRARRLPALVLGAGLVLGPSVALAPAAWAAGSVLTPSAGTVYETDTTVELTARVEARSAATEMRVVDPSGAGRTVRTAGPSLTAQTLRFGLETDCPALGADCTGRRPARNGTWTVQLTGGATDSRTFELRIPPRAPDGVRAEATGPRTVVVTWPRGAEPDLVGYTVLSGDGSRLPAGDSACDAGTCRSTVTYAADGPSTDSVVVRAERACPGCSVLTASSSPVSVTRPAGAPAGPGSGPAPGGDAPGGGGADAGTGGAGTTGGSTGSTGGPTGTDGGGTGGSGTGGPGAGSGGAPAAGPTPGRSGSPSAPPATGGPGTASGPLLAGPGITVTRADQPDAFALTFKAFGPKLGLPKLPPLPATGVAAPPDVAPLPDGTFTGELPFDERTEVERVPTLASGPVDRVGQAVSAAVDSERLVRSTAAALVLLLVGAHVRRWLAQGPVEP